MGHPNILIKDGHAGSAERYEDIPNLEGFLASNDGARVRLPNDVDLNALSMHLPRIKTILVEFPSFSDGRGFSIARQLRKQHGYQGELIAAGPMIPDQYVYALQCGFDAVAVDGHTFERQADSHWFNALDAFGVTYQRGYDFKNGPAISIFDARQTSQSAVVSDDPYFGLSAAQSIEKALGDYDGSIVMASSMGIDSAVLLHMAAQIDKNLPVIFLDTGKHFRETLHYRDLLVSELGLSNFTNIVPKADSVSRDDPDGLLNEHSPDACCDLRKVQPLADSIKGYKLRITGRKRYQTPERANMNILETDGPQHKLNPLAYWNAKDVNAYMRKHDLPPHPLLSLGYLSIGCQPCTTRVTEGEDERAGRWRNQTKEECGIHYVDGKWIPIPNNSPFEVF